VLGGYTVWMAVLIAVYYGLPALRAEAWGLIGLSGVAAIVTGVAVHRPLRRAPWLLLAAALACFATGQVSYLIAHLIGVQLPFPSFVDALYVMTYLLYAAGLAIISWWRTPEHDRRSLIDALILTAGLALLSWIYLILPYVHNPGLSGLQKDVAIAYPLGDVLILAMLARLLAPGTGKARCVQLLTLGVVAGLAADVSYGAISLYGSFHNGTVIDLGWAVLYGAWGAAALHPSMTELTTPVTRQPAEVSPVRLTVLMLASLIAPTVLFISSFLHRNPEDRIIAVFSAILFLLVLTRLWDMATSHRRTLRRERAVRQAGAALVAAATVDQVAAAVRAATDLLLGPAQAGDVLLAVGTGNTLRAVPAASAGPQAMSQLAGLAGPWLVQAGNSGSWLAPVSALPGPARALVPGAQSVLVCPLALEGRPSGDPLLGVLAVFGDQRTLADLSATMEILAHQVALAVEQIELRGEVTRRDSEAYFRTLVQDTSEAILIVGDGGIIRYATPSASTIFGDVDIEGASLRDLVADGELDDLAGALHAAPAITSASARYMDRQITRRDGVRVQVQVRASDLRGDPTVAGLVLTLRDVTEQHQLEDQLKHQAYHDALTGLPNRLLFQDRIAPALAAVQRRGGVCGVLFVDVDDFKTTNDTMGHGVGDELLAAVAARLTGLIREGDTAARLGGDEFALLITDVADPAAVESAAARVIQAFSIPFELGTATVMATVTIGVATTKDSADTDELLRHADLALYAGKAAGKRQWRRYQPVLSAGMIRRRELTAALEEAVGRSAFTLAYQPIVSLASGELAGFEALIRWPHPEWGMMQPDQFIALAEETGLIVPLGSWVLTQAATDLARWRRETSPHAQQTAHGVYVGVNVSARQFTTPGFVDGVRRVLDISGLPPGALTLELTESVLLREDDRVHADLHALRDMGVKLAIDDFGTGYSSLSYLPEFPIDVLKMDKSFVDGIAVDSQRLALAESIVQIARTFQLQVIAEGIENEVQWDLLTSMGCQYGQGYLLAMPMPAQQAETLTRIGSRFIPSLPRQAAGPETPL